MESKVIRSESIARVIGVNFIGPITHRRYQGLGGNLSPKRFCAEYKCRIGAVANSGDRVCIQCFFGSLMPCPLPLSQLTLALDSDPGITEARINDADASTPDRLQLTAIFSETSNSKIY